MKKTLITITILFSLILIAPLALAETRVYFYGESDNATTQSMNIFIQEMEGKYQGLMVERVYTDESEENAKEFKDMYEARSYFDLGHYKTVIYVGEEVIFGYEPAKLEEAIMACQGQECIDPKSLLTPDTNTNASEIDVFEEPKFEESNKVKVIISIMVVLIVVTLVYFAAKKSKKEPEKEE